jgi:hypothetical protein
MGVRHSLTCRAGRKRRTKARRATVPKFIQQMKEPPAGSSTGVTRVSQYEGNNNLVSTTDSHSERGAETTPKTLHISYYTEQCSVYYLEMNYCIYLCVVYATVMSGSDFTVSNYCTTVNGELKMIWKKQY